MNFFDQVVSQSGLAAVFAQSAIQRACSKANLSPVELSPATLHDVLPHIEAMLRIYLLPGECDARVRILRALAVAPER